MPAPEGGTAPPDGASASPPRGGAGERPAPGGVRLLPALVAGQLGLHAQMAGVRMAAPLQALNEGHSPWAVGVLLALFAAAPVLTALPAGRLADRRGYHPLVAGAAVLGFAGAALALLATQLVAPWRFAALAVAAVCCGTAANVGLLTTQRTAGLSARDGTERLRVFSWLGVAPSLANVVGPVAVGFMIDGFGFAAGYAVMLALPLLTLAAMRAVPRLRPAAAAASPGSATAAALLRSPGMIRLLLLNWLLSTCWDVHTFAVPVIGHERGFSAGTIGLVLGTFTLAVTGVRLLIPMAAHRLSATRVLGAAMLGTGIVFAAYPLAPDAAAMAALALLLGLALGSVQPMIMAILHHLTPPERHGEALALRSMAINASSTAMPLVFGAVGAAVGAAVLFWVVGAAVATGAALVRGLPHQR